MLTGFVAPLCAPLALAAVKALQKLVAELIDAPQTANFISIIEAGDNFLARQTL
ncbi:hypothetical protein [Pelagibacterium sp. H642]|uniref:hypothetical protein n=1 Tax=Pelagibacterium sp. H642 TaxID=1881069 RepID=UPI0028169E38|nr:hypothetical protein [Pelagibacterium sp. H642]WMT92000.1 hypothetical protein NO934_07015 [Pelagibacterium sp. H642]